jgi:hypothetical protein
MAPTAPETRYPEKMDTVPVNGGQIHWVGWQAGWWLRPCSLPVQVVPVSSKSVQEQVGAAQVCLTRIRE